MSRLSTGLLFALIMLTASPAAAQSAGKVYVGVFRDDAAAVIDSSTNRVLRTVTVPKGPHGLVLTPDGRKVYVSSDGASTVSVIDTATDQVVTSIDVDLPALTSRSGTTASWSTAKRLPVRPKPLITSSAIVRIPRRRQISATRAR